MILKVAGKSQTNKIISEYSPKEIEGKWQSYWLTNKTFSTSCDLSKPKYYILDMFPYPSSAGLHVGHPEGYTATDIVSRYKRMRGFNVLHPMGWDAFGLPAEQYAIETGTHPADTTRRNIDNFRRQIQALGFSYDWDREVATCDPDYYRWTQWIFIQLYKKGLAYMDDVPVNWCPALGTVLANEEIIDGKSERGGHDVIRKPMRQWVLKITDYAESLLAGLDDLDWPQGVIDMQRNWIGRSEGAHIRFRVAENEDISFEVFTTRPDTLFGATYAVLSPEHPIITSIASESQRDKVIAYVEEAKQKSDRLRLEEATKKTGVFTGAHATNPANGKKIPIFVADYVLMTYGTGAIMAVPAHDQRDWEFARKFSLECIEVVSGSDVSSQAFEGDGILINSGFLNGLDVASAKQKMLAWLEANRLGARTVRYKLRDWLFSRQRYWGEPFPIIHTADGPKLLDAEELPILLPDIENFKPTAEGEPPLARAPQWVNTTDPRTGEPAKRETNTMPQWAGSCWYYLRYLDPKNEAAAWSKEAENYWMPVDLYVGGVEHAVLHLLYSRFWHHVLYDLGLVSTKEPFKRLVNQGMILGEDNQKMSKSRGNVVNPDEIINKYGADTLRLYEMFMGPLEQVKPWNTSSVSGMRKFLGRVWRLVVSEDGCDIQRNICQNGVISSDSEVNRGLHRTIQKVTEDIEDMRFHTAIAELMSFLNYLVKLKEIPFFVVETYVLLLSPFAPHIAEELWKRLGHASTLAYEPWPTFNPELAKRLTATIALQINGKLRDTIEVDVNSSKEDILLAAKESAKIMHYLHNNEIAREIVVSGRLVNFVLKE